LLALIKIKDKVIHKIKGRKKKFIKKAVIFFIKQKQKKTDSAHLRQDKLCKRKSKKIYLKKKKSIIYGRPNNKGIVTQFFVFLGFFD
jgi:nitrogenase molybdenum-iron protein alpha/beta subunit